jgi:hypothetical protein
MATEKIHGVQLPCKVCGLTVVVGRDRDHGRFFHETPVCDWFTELVHGAEDMGVRDVTIEVQKDGPSVGTRG